MTVSLSINPSSGPAGEPVSISMSSTLTFTSPTYTLVFHSIPSGSSFTVSQSLTHFGSGNLFGFTPDVAGTYTFGGSIADTNHTDTITSYPSFVGSAPDTFTASIDKTSISTGQVVTLQLSSVFGVSNDDQYTVTSTAQSGQYPTLSSGGTSDWSYEGFGAFTGGNGNLSSLPSVLKLLFSTAGTYTLLADGDDGLSGNELPGAPQTFTVTVTATPDTTPPSVPTGLVASSVTSTSFSLSWTASTDNVGVTGYLVTINGGTTTASVATNSASFTGLIGGNTYAAQVRAFDAAGNLSAWSSALSVTTTIPTGTLYVKNPNTGGYYQVGGSTSSLPTGGTTGQVLAKNSATNGDVHWVTDSSALPTGNTSGYVLTLTGASPFTPNWVAVPTEVPSTGATGTVLTKTGTGNTWSWQTLPTGTVPSGGTAGQVLSQTSGGSPAWASLPTAQQARTDIYVPGSMVTQVISTPVFWPVNTNIVTIAAILGTAAGTQNTIIDVRDEGSTIFGSGAKLNIAYTGAYGSISPGYTVTANHRVTIAITQVGSAPAGSDLVVSFFTTPAS